MRIFWHQGGLRLEPETPEEVDALSVLISDLKLAKPPAAEPEAERLGDLAQGQSPRKEQ